MPGIWKPEDPKSQLGHIWPDNILYLIPDSSKSERRKQERPNNLKKIWHMWKIPIFFVDLSTGIGRLVNISWFGPGSPYFFILLHQNTWIKSRKNQGTSLEKMENVFSKKVETQEFRNSGNLNCPFFEFLKFRIPGFFVN